MLFTVSAAADQQKLVIDSTVHVTPSSLSFLGGAVGQNLSGRFALINTDNVPKTISAWKFNTNCAPGSPSCLPPPVGYDDFSVAGGCGVMLLPGETCEIQVDFARTDGGRRSASVLISANGVVVGGFGVVADEPVAVPAGNSGGIAFVIFVAAIGGIKSARSRTLRQSRI